MNLQQLFSSMFILQNWRPLKIGGPRPNLPNGQTGPAGSVVTWGGAKELTYLLTTW